MNRTKNQNKLLKRIREYEQEMGITETVDDFGLTFTVRYA